MIEMSVDKETVLANERPPPPPGQHPELYEQCTEDPLQPLGHKAKPDGGLNLGEGGAEENGNHKTSHQTLDSSIQSLNYVQQSKSQPRLKRRSTMNSGFKHPIFGKRRRRANSESESVLPTNFLLGGNIFDPLNLNSLLDEEVNRALNAETPKSSPLPAKSRDPVEILIPRDITDPLNLNCCTAGDSTGGLLLTPLKTAGGGRRRHRNRHHGVGGSGRGGEGPVTQLYLSLPESEKARTFPELTLASSGSHLDSVETSETSTEEVVETKIESKLESNDIPTQESQTQCPSDPNLTTSREEMDEMPSVVENAATSTNVPHRHRKRKRTTSKSENSAAPNCEKAKATASGNQPQPNHPQGIVPQTQPPQQPNHRRHQKIQQNPNQHQQQNKNHHQHQQQKKKFQYGNYDKYYGYRNPGSTEDPRLWTLKPEWFKGKEVLDLGCNTGRLTLTIAKNWRPSRIVGLDIDGALIHAARQNIRYYLSEMHVLRARSRRVDDSGGKETKGDEGKEADHQELAGRKESDATVERAERPGVSSEVQEERKKDRGDEERESIEEKMDGSADVKETSREPESEGREDRTRKGKEGEEKEEVKADAVQAVSSSSSENHSFPISLRISRGPIAAPPLPDTNTPPPGNFPSNVTFVKGNYVLESDVLLLTQREEYDVVLCLSVTKWVHLNWGDVGLKRFFQRVYRHLRPGGLFILEPQPWHSYGKRKKLTETITKNYYSIRLKPEQFSSYLMSDEVGFSSYELIGTPNNSSRGFQRPIYLFHKGPTPQK